MENVGDSLPAIHFAVEQGTVEIIEIVLNAGQDVNLLDEDGETPLHKAAMYGTVEDIQCLLKHRADFWMRGGDDRSVLDCSLRYENLAVFDYLLERGLELDPPEYWKEDELTMAAHRGNLHACQKLLEFGANVNGNPHSSETPLFKSTKTKGCGVFQKDVFDLLMKKGADLYVGDASKESALNMAAASHVPEAVEELIERDPKIVQWSCREGYFGALHAAAKNGRVKACQLLLEHGADVNVRDDKGRTPLMDSAQFYTLDALEFLIESGADLQIGDNDGWSVMEYAIDSRRNQSIHLLRENGMQLPANIPDRVMNGQLVKGQDLMHWLHQNFAN
ncbi:ankyrin repeat-containing domain protein [Gorgonomyces haynaldii]|nr:ankyrin repeat-containing domain protein [Gorgonomyces haynaldii]